MRNFDKHFKDMQSRHDKTAGLMVKGAAVFGLAWVIWAVVCLAAAGGLVYVAWHFISKFW